MYIDTIVVFMCHARRCEGSRTATNAKIHATPTTLSYVIRVTKNGANAWTAWAHFYIFFSHRMLECVKSILRIPTQKKKNSVPEEALCPLTGSFQFTTLFTPLVFAEPPLARCTPRTPSRLILPGPPRVKYCTTRAFPKGGALPPTASDSRTLRRRKKTPPPRSATRARSREKGGRGKEGGHPRGPCRQVWCFFVRWRGAKPKRGAHVSVPQIRAFFDLLSLGWRRGSTLIMGLAFGDLFFVLRRGDKTRQPLIPIFQTFFMARTVSRCLSRTDY